MALTQIITWVYKDPLTLTYPPNILHSIEIIITRPAGWLYDILFIPMHSPYIPLQHPGTYLFIHDG